jgi:hypothetical protein
LVLKGASPIRHCDFRPPIRPYRLDLDYRSPRLSKRVGKFRFSILELEIEWGMVELLRETFVIALGPWPIRLGIENATTIAGGGSFGTSL